MAKRTMTVFPNPLGDPIPEPLKQKILSHYPFALESESLANTTCRHIGTLTKNGKTIEIVGMTDHNYATTGNVVIRQKQGIAIEGIAGVGKSTLLRSLIQPHDNCHGDLQDQRNSPFACLTGVKEEHSFCRQTLRARCWDKHSILDRSDWLAPMVYSAYAFGVFVLYENPHIIDWLLNMTDYDVVIMEDAALTDEQIHERITTRALMDKNVPLEYTILTRRLFKFAALHYGLPVLQPDEIKQLICD